MSSLSWDVPSSSSNPSADDDDLGEVNGNGRPDAISDFDDDDASEREQIEALERELLEQLEREQMGLPEPEPEPEPEPVEPEPVAARERDEPDEVDLERAQLEAMEQEQLARLAQMANEIEGSEQSERQQLEELEREQLRQLGLLEDESTTPAAAEPPPPPAAPPRRAARPRPAPTPAPSWTPSAPVANDPPALDTAALAAQFLAASERRTSDEASWGPQSSGPATELRELSEPARAARAIVEHRHQGLVEANALLTEARRVLAPMAYRGLSDSAYRRRKIILGIGEAVSLAIAFSAAFDVAPLEGLLLSGAIALAFVIAGDLGGVLRLTAERSRLSAALESDVVHLDQRYHHILFHDRQPWLSIIGGVTAAVFALATVSVGVLRAANQGSVGLAAGLGLLTVSLAIAAGLSSWQHASIGSEIIDHLQREEEAAGRRLKRAAAARVLRRPQLLGSVRGDELQLPSRAPDIDWSAPAPQWPPPDLDYDTPTAELRPNRPKRSGRGPRAKPAKREKRSGSLLGAAAARGAVFLATLPSKARRPDDAGPKKESKKESKRESKIEDMSVAGDGPGALGESAGPISAVAFRPPIVAPKKFG